MSPRWAKFEIGWLTEILSNPRLAQPYVTQIERNKNLSLTMLATN